MLNMVCYQGLQVKTTKRYRDTLKIYMTLPNADKGVEQQGLSFIAGGTAKLLQPRCPSVGEWINCGISIQLNVFQ